LTGRRRGLAAAAVAAGGRHHGAAVDAYHTGQWPHGYERFVHHLQTGTCRRQGRQSGILQIGHRPSAAGQCPATMSRAGRIILFHTRRADESPVAADGSPIAGRRADGSVIADRRADGSSLGRPGRTPIASSAATYAQPAC